MPQRIGRALPLPSFPKVCSGAGGPECLDAIRQGDSTAAHVLYAGYAGQIRRYLRRHTGIHDVEGTVFDVLIEAVRWVRELESPTIEELSQTVRELSQQGVFALRRSRAAQRSAGVGHLALEHDRELINGVFTVLDRREREILLRSFLLSESDDGISTELNLPVLQILKTRAKARVLYRISSQFGLENVAAGA